MAKAKDELDVNIGFSLTDDALLEALNHATLPTKKLYPESGTFPKLKAIITNLNEQDLSDLQPKERAEALLGIVKGIDRIGLIPSLAIIKDNAVEVEFVLIEPPEA